MRTGRSELLSKASRVPRSEPPRHLFVRHSPSQSTSWSRMLWRRKQLTPFHLPPRGMILPRHLLAHPSPLAESIALEAQAARTTLASSTISTSIKGNEDTATEHPIEDQSVAQSAQPELHRTVLPKSQRRASKTWLLIGGLSASTAWTNLASGGFLIARLSRKPCTAQVSRTVRLPACDHIQRKITAWTCIASSSFDLLVGTTSFSSDTRTPLGSCTSGCSCMFTSAGD